MSSYTHIDCLHPSLEKPLLVELIVNVQCLGYRVDVKSIIGNGKLRLHTWVATGPPLLANSEFEEPAFLRNSGSGASRDPSKAVVCPVCGKVTAYIVSTSTAPCISFN